MHCEVLTEPFATASPKLLELVCTSLVAILSTCWPRLDQPTYQDELVKALVLCFLNVHDNLATNGDLKRIRSKLLILGRMLYTIGKNSHGTRLADQVAPLIAKESLLRELFIAPESH